MKIITKLILAALLLISLNTVFGQSGDVSYPLLVECSENPLSAGDLAVFTAKFSPEIKTDDLSFNWTTNLGELTEGQGTSSIKVKLPEDGDSVTATLKIGGSSLWVGSQTTASCTVSINQIPKAQLITETGHPSGSNRILARTARSVMETRHFSG